MSGAIKKFIPFANNILIKKVTLAQKTAGGILLPKAEKSLNEAEVIRVGPGKLVKGKIEPVPVKPGDHVYVSTYGGNEVKIDNIEYNIITENDILGKLA